MTFDLDAYHAFVKLLYQHPELRAEVRQLVLSEEILTLPQVVRELAEAQKRTEQRVEELAEAQKRTEKRVEELAEVQKRSEERLTRLEQVVVELAEAQKRTEQRVEELAQAQRELSEAQKRTEQRVEELAQAQRELAEAQKRTDRRLDEISSKLGRLEHLVGVEIEAEAAEMLLLVLKQKGYLPVSDPLPLALNGEVDVILRVRNPQGQEWTAVLESKVRLGGSDVKRWADRMRSASFQKKLKRAGYPGPYLVYMYSIRVNQAALEFAREKGVGIIKPSGEVQEAAVLEALS